MAVEQKERVSAKTKMYVWDRACKKRVFVMKTAEDRVTLNGLAVAKQGKYLTVKWGVYETSDPSEQEFLERSGDFNGGNLVRRFTVADEETAALIAKFRKNGVQPAHICRQLRQHRAVEAGVNVAAQEDL